METARFILKSWSLVLVISATAIIAAAMQPSPDASATQDKMFVAQASEGSLAEVELGKLALKKSKNPEVKEFAQKMVDDHTQLINDMKPVAEQLGVKPPTKVNAKHQQEADHLSGLSGDEFDKAYITAMVADHHHDLSEFTAEESRTQNEMLKSTVSKGKQVIEMHTHMIDQIAQKNGIQTPGTPT
jgi:putative membrane protein